MSFQKNNITPEKNKPVAVFDSGIGGISVLKELTKFLPNEDFWYFGDSANAPYGTKSMDEIRNLSCGNIGRMIQAGAKAVVIACNTATSAAAATLREQYENIPVIGMEPEIKTPALLHQNSILVMATPMTLKMEKFNRLLEQFKTKADFIIQPCAGLTELIEQGKINSQETREYLQSTLVPHINSHIEAIVLGCTHYLHIKPLIREILGDAITFYDGAMGAARELKRKLADQKLINGQHANGRITIENSSNSDEIIKLCHSLLT